MNELAIGISVGAVIGFIGSAVIVLVVERMVRRHFE